jgi:hypothetical protein
VPIEMLSGPDLGAGFLFQLTVDRAPGRLGLTYHAQEGGIDANGPPKGSPVPLGFARAPGLCPLGGRFCYHRHFVIDGADPTAGRMAYNRLRFVMAAMMDQEYAGASVPLDAALVELHDRLSAGAGPLGDAWFVAGLTAAYLRGAAVRPHEIELGLTLERSREAAERLREYLIEPWGSTEWPKRGPVRGARAFVGTLAEGVRVAWGQSEGRSTDSDEWSELAVPADSVPTDRVEWKGRAFRTSRLEYALVRSALAAAWDDAAAVAVILQRSGPDRDLLDRLTARAALGPAARDRLRTLLANAA